MVSNYAPGLLYVNGVTKNPPAAEMTSAGEAAKSKPLSSIISSPAKAV